MNKGNFISSNSFHLGYSSNLRLFFLISYLVVFIPIILPIISILIIQRNFEVVGIFIPIGLIVFLALCFERDMIVKICQDGLVITKIATIYQKEEKFHIYYSDITNIYVKRIIGMNYSHDIYVISSKGNNDIELLPIDKKNIRLKFYLDDLNRRFTKNDNNYAKSNKDRQKQENVLSIWKTILLVLLMLTGVLFRVIKSIM